jgi:hypothetical protein
MISQSENRIDHLGTTIIFIFCFFFLASFHQNSKNPDSSKALRYQLAAQHSVAIPSKDIPQLWPFQGFMSKSDETNFIHLTEQLRLFAHNKLINQRIDTLHKVALLIKPVHQEFYYHQQSLSSEDFPILS